MTQIILFILLCALFSLLITSLAYYAVYKRSFYGKLNISFFDFIFNTRKCQIAFKQHVASIMTDSLKKLVSELKTPEKLDMWPETLSNDDHVEIKRNPLTNNYECQVDGKKINICSGLPRGK
jgi:hypothetical protein